MEINDKEIKSFAKDFMQALKSVEEKYDTKISIGKISYTDKVFSFKVTVNNTRDPEQIASDNFDNEVWKYEEYGLEVGMYRKMFIGADGNKYALMGFKANAKKGPVLIQRISDGKPFRCSPSFIKDLLPSRWIEADQGK